MSRIMYCTTYLPVNYKINNINNQLNLSDIIK